MTAIITPARMVLYTLTFDDAAQINRRREDFSDYRQHSGALTGHIAHYGNHAFEGATRSEEHTSELQSLMRISYAVFCLKKKQHTHQTESPLINSNRFTTIYHPTL